MSEVTPIQARTDMFRLRHRHFRDTMPAFRSLDFPTSLADALINGIYPRLRGVVQAQMHWDDSLTVDRALLRF